MWRTLYENERRLDVDDSLAVLHTPLGNLALTLDPLVRATRDR